VSALPPAAATTIIARVFGQKLSESLGQPSLSKTGRRRRIVAMEHVEDPRRTDIPFGPAPSGIAVNPAVYAKLPYDAIRDFVAVSELAAFPLILL